MSLLTQFKRAKCGKGCHNCKFAHNAYIETKDATNMLEKLLERSVYGENDLEENPKEYLKLLHCNKGIDITDLFYVCDNWEVAEPIVENGEVIQALSEKQLLACIFNKNNFRLATDFITELADTFKEDGISRGVYTISLESHFKGNHLEELYDSGDIPLDFYTMFRGALAFMCEKAGIDMMKLSFYKVKDEPIIQLFAY